MAERVWDKFLSEQDKAHLGQRNRQKTVTLGKKPGLLLVDLYRNVFGDGPQPLLEAGEEWPGSCGPAAWDAVPHIQELLRVSREVGIPVTHVTMLVNTGVDGWSAPRRKRQTKDGKDPRDLVERDDLYEIIPEVGPIAGEAVIRKASPSAFWGTPLIGHLNVHEVDTLIVCGESTSGCVRATVVDACTNRYRVIVAEEAVFDRHEAPHAINLFDMDSKYADVIPVSEVARLLREWNAAKEQPEAQLAAPTLS